MTTGESYETVFVGGTALTLAESIPKLLWPEILEYKNLFQQSKVNQKFRNGEKMLDYDDVGR